MSKLTVMKNLLVAAAASLMLMVCSPARADTLTYSDNIATPFLGTKTLHLQQFDPALGTLTGVTLTAGGDLMASWTCTNTGASQASAYLLVEQHFTISMGTSTLLSISNHTKDHYTAGLDFGDPIFNGMSTNQIILPVGVPTTVTLWNTPVATTVTATDFSRYIGTGTADLTVNSNDSVGLSITGGNWSEGSAIEADAGATVTYSYTAVPEPATVALLALGGLALLKRTRKS